MARFEAAKESTSFTSMGADSKPTKGTRVTSIPVVRVDDLVPHDVPIFLFKTDTQGFEFGVLQGAENMLQGNNVFFLLIEFSYILLQRAGTDHTALLNYVYDRGYICTHMAFHTRLKSDSKSPSYGIVPNYPKYDTDSLFVSFEDFIDSLRGIHHPVAAGVPGWTDLLCIKC